MKLKPKPVAKAAIRPQDLTRALAEAVGQGMDLEQMVAFVSAFAWCHGLLTAAVSTAQGLTPDQYERIAQASKDQWRNGVRAGLSASPARSDASTIMESV